MWYILIFILGIGIRYVNYLFDLNESVNNSIINTIKYKSIKYYSNGIELPFSFSKEYKVVLNNYFNEVFTKSQIESEYINLIGSNTEIVRTIINPITKIETEFIYNNEMFYLAKEFLINEHEYLSNLN